MILCSVLVAVAVGGGIGAAQQADDTVVVDDDWESNESGDVVGDGYVLGTNATATISAALEMSDTDRIVVRDGTYKERVVVDEQVRLVAENRSDATVRYDPGTEPTGAPTIAVTAAGAQVRGFDIVRVAAGGRDSGSPPAYGIRLSASDIVVADNVVDGEGFAGPVSTGVAVTDDESGEPVENVTLSGTDIEGFTAPVSIAAVHGGSVESVALSGNTLSGTFPTGISVTEREGSVNVALPSAYAYEVRAATYPATTVHFTNQRDALALASDDRVSDGVVTDGEGTYLVAEGMSIRDALNASEDGDTIEIYPGTYRESAGADGVGLSVDTANVTIRGVTDRGVPVSDREEIRARVVAQGGPDGANSVYVAADGVTISGIELSAAPQVSDLLRNVEVAGDEFALRNAVVSGSEGMGLDGTVYFGTSDVQSFAVTGSRIEGALTVANGTGDATPASNRVVSDSRIWITLFAGNVADRPAWNRPIGDVRIVDNTIRTGAFARNTTTPDLRAIRRNNVFEGGSAVALAPSGDVRSNDGTRSVFSPVDNTISQTIDAAQSGDTVSVAPGTYEERVVVDKSITLTAPTGATISYEPKSASKKSTIAVTANDTAVTGFTVERVAASDRTADAPPTQGIRVSASNVTIANGSVVGSGLSTGESAGVRVDGGASVGRNVSITDTSVSGFPLPFAAAANAEVNAPGYEVRVTTESATYYFETERTAKNAASRIGAETIQNESSATFLVAEGMSIQDALDASDDGDTVRVEAGTYAERLSVETNVTLVGAGEGATVVESPAASDSSETAETPIVSVTDADATISSLSVEGTEDATAVLVRDENGENRTVRLRNVAVSDSDVGVAVASGRVEITDSEFANNSQHVDDDTDRLDATALLADNAFASAAYLTDGDGAVGGDVYGDLDRAVEAADAGQTVHVEPGTYDETAEIPTDGVTLTGTDATLTGGLRVAERPEGVTIRGFTFAGPEAAIHVDGVGGDLTITDNAFDGSGAAVVVDGTVRNRSAVLVHDNRFAETNSDGVRVVDAADATGRVNATYNYWGASTGPGGTAPGAGSSVSENVSFRPFYTDAGLTERSTEPPTVTDATLVDASDGDGVVGDGDVVRVSARVTDASGVANVTTNARAFGRSDALSLTHGGDDPENVYDAAFAVDIANATSPDGDWSLSVRAADHGGASSEAATNALTLDGESETRTTYAVSETNPLSTDPVTVPVTVENVGHRAADRTLTLVVDGDAVANRSVTVPAGANETVTFEWRFEPGEHTITVGDGAEALDPTAVTARPPTNPDADVRIADPTEGTTVANDAVTVAYDLRNVSEGIANLTYEVDGETATVTDLTRTSVRISNLSDGAHTATLTLVDNVGTAVAADSVTFAVDTESPVVTLTPARTANVGVERPVEVGLGVADVDGETVTFAVRRDGTTVYSDNVTDEFTDSTATVTWNGTDDAGRSLASGEYELLVRATDGLGRSNVTTATVAVNNGAPAVESVAANRTTVGGGDSVAVDVVASDAESAVDSVTVTLVSEDVNYRTSARATRTDGGWRATFDAADLAVDGDYAVRATAVDAANNADSATAGEGLSVDTAAPTVRAVVDVADAETGYVNVSVSEPVRATPDVTLVGPDGDPVGVELDRVGDVRYSATFDPESGAYDLSATATDRAGNIGETSAGTNVSTLTASRRHTVALDDGTSITLVMSEPTDGVAAFTASETPLADLRTNVGTRFLAGELDETLSANLKHATIRIPVAGNVPSGTDPSNVQIRRYNESTGRWEAISETRVVENETGAAFFVATVDTFSTYGAVAPDDAAPSIDATALSPDRDSIRYGTDAVEVSVAYSDNDRVDAGNVTVRFDGVDVTDDAATSVSPREVTYAATGLTPGGTHWLNVTVPDAAGNANATNVSFTVPGDADAPTVTPAFADSYPYGTETVPVRFDFDDGQSGVDADSVTLTVDGRDVTDAATVTADGVAYDAVGLDSGEHAVVVSVADAEDNAVTATRTVTVAADTTAPNVTAVDISPAATDGVLPIGTTTANVTLTYEDAASGVDAGAVEVTFDGRDVTNETAIDGSTLRYTAVGLRNGERYTLDVTLADREGNAVTRTVEFAVDARATGGGDDGGNGRNGGSAGATDLVSAMIVEGRADLDVGGSIGRLRVDFGRGGTGDYVSARALDGRPASVPAIPNATGRAFVDVTVPQSREDRNATLRFTVDAAAIGDADPAGLTVYHYHGGEWTALDTSVVSADGAVTVEAETPGFSVFAVGTADAAPEGTETPDASGGDPTATAAGTEPPATDVSSTGATPNTEEPAAVESPTEEPIRERGGFDTGALVLVVGLLALLAVYVGYRRF